MAAAALERQSNIASTRAACLCVYYVQQSIPRLAPDIDPPDITPIEQAFAKIKHWMRGDMPARSLAVSFPKSIETTSQTSGMLPLKYEAPEIVSGRRFSEAPSG